MLAQVMPLCTKQRIARDYATLNKAKLVLVDGTELRLYPSLLALLLRLSSIRGGDPAEIARRTKEVPEPASLETGYGAMSQDLLRRDPGVVQWGGGI